MAYHQKYTTPAQLMEDRSLNAQEKVTILKQWLEDEESRLRASGEGMAGKDRPDILKQVNNALLSLEPHVKK